ncbi:hypothetical protein GGX14DRAFT_555363 [Mycena pura]|uniref:Uncharacterized protein n=1 Tax=Mycena pura TaxID=153505 RepID=A0AAD6YQW7_9AGAR|nr:hypothetical protein GGX14DRAFT_555363 [Mycena pura]
MPRRKSNLSRQDILERQAQAAWEYRQRNKVTINQKAKERMRERRQRLLTAPSAVQLEYATRAARYRRNYLERTKKPAKISVQNRTTSPAKPKKAAKFSVQNRASSPEKPKKAVKSKRPPGGTTDFKIPPARPARSFPKGRQTTPPSPCASRGASMTNGASRRHTSSPRALKDIDAESSNAESSGEGEGESNDAEADNDEEDEAVGGTHMLAPLWDEADLGPLLNPTGHPDYVPHRGQRPYIRGGRRYWF